MTKDLELDQIHNNYNNLIVSKDMTIQNFSEKHNNEVNTITTKYQDKNKNMSKTYEVRINNMNEDYKININQLQDSLKDLASKSRQLNNK